MAPTKQINALVIGLAQFREDFEQSANRSTMNMSFLSPDKEQGCHDNGCVSLPKSLETIEKIIEEKSIDAVLGINDGPSLLHAALVHKYPNKFQGPSPTSVFLAYNKYYTRQYLDPDPIPFCHIDVSKPLTKDDLEKDIQKVGLPAIMKPTGGDFSSSIKKITSLEDLSSFVDDVRMNYQPSTSDSTVFLAQHLADKEIPMEKTEGFILEQFVDTPFKVSVDGYICNKEVVHWTIGDNCYWASHPECYKMTAVPSTLPPETQENIWDVFDQIAERLIHYGYNNGFVNQEFFVKEDGGIKLMEINPRPTMALSRAYCHVLENGNFIETCLQISRGIRPKDPQLQGKSICCFGIFCMISGKVEDIVNFEVLDSLPEVYCKGYKQGDYMNPVGDAGNVFVAGALVASNREELLCKHKNLFDRLFKINPMGHCF